MEGRERAKEREDSPHFDLKKKRSRHNNFRSSIFSTPAKERSTSFARGFAAAAAGAPSFLAAMSGGQGARSGDETPTESHNADREAVRAAMGMDASSRGDARERGGGGGGGGAGGGGKAAGEDEGEAGGAEPGADGRGRDGGAETANRHKGKHWSSAAAACVLGGHLPSPRAAAAVAARAVEVGAGHERRNGSGGSGGGGGGVFSYSGGKTRMIAGSGAKGGNGGVDGGAAAAVAHSVEGVATTAAAGTAAPAPALARAPAEKEKEKEKERPRPKSVWERGGAAPAPKTVWRQLIDPPSRGGTEGGRDGYGGTRSSRWNRGTAAAEGEGGGVPGGFTGVDGESRAQGWAVAQSCGGCLSCCGCRSRDEGSGGSDNYSTCRSVCCRPLWCKTQSRRSSSSRGGALHPANRNPTRRIPSRNGRNNNLTNSSSSGSNRSGGSGIKASAAFLGIGLVLKVAASLWAFQQAAQAGALSGDGDGIAGVAIAALAVALCGQALEAAVGVACLKDPSRSGGDALLAELAATEAVGVVAVAAVLMLFLPSFSDTTTTTHAEAWPVWAAVASAIAGVLLEAIPAGFDRAADRLPFLGALGHALLWLGIAALEVLVALFLIREAEEGSTTATAAAAAAAAGQSKTLAVVLEGGEVVGLVVVEAVALLAMWVARGLWTRARLLLAVKGQEGPSRRRSSHFTRFDSV